MPRPVEEGEGGALSDSLESLRATVRATIQELAERADPGLWAALSEEGQDRFMLSVLDALSLAPEDQMPAFRRTIQAWLDAFDLIQNAPLDDEPFTDEELREVEEAEARLDRGEGVPLSRRRR